MTGPEYWEHLEAAGYTKTRLARELGVERSHMTRMLAGERPLQQEHRELLDALLVREGDGVTEPADEEWVGVDAEDLAAAAGADPEERMGRRRYLAGAGLVAIVLIIIIVVVAVAFIAGSDEEPNEEASPGPDPTATTDGDCQIAPGAREAGGAGRDEEVEGFALAFEDAGGQRAVGCPTSSIYQWEDCLRQDLTTEGWREGAILGDGKGFAAVLFGPIWNTYRRDAGTEAAPEEATALMGCPTSITSDRNGRMLIVLSLGGVLAVEHSDAPAAWLPAPVRQYWEEHGAAEGTLGWPASSPRWTGSGLRQDFSNGYLTLDLGGTFAELRDVAAQGELPLVFTPVTGGQAEGELPETGDLSGKLLGQDNGVAWWVDDEGRRHWVPDQPTWTCLGGEDNYAKREDGERIRAVPGYVIFQLPVGDLADCT
jgi:hypothetical protein